MKAWIGFALFGITLLLAYVISQTHNPLDSTVQSFNQVKNQLQEDASTQLLSIMTFNIRWADLNNKEDNGLYSWSERRTKAYEIITGISPDVVGLQEALMLQHNDIVHTLNPHGYDSVGFCRVAMLYKKSKLKLLDSGEFWIEPNPDKSERHAWARRATWAKFRIITTASSLIPVDFIVINTHNDPRSEAKRRQNAQIIIDKVAEMSHNGTIPFFVIGDFNAAPSHYSHDMLLSSGMTDTWQECLLTSKATTSTTSPSTHNCVSHDMTSSYHHYFGPQVNDLGWRILIYLAHIVHGRGHVPTWDRYHIDWILYHQNPIVKISPYFAQVVVEPFDYKGQHASDHFPVVALFGIHSHEYNKK